MQLLTKIQDDFTYGLYKRFGTYLAPPNSASKLQNYRVDKGGMEKIGGYAKLNTSAIGASAIATGYRAYIETKSITLVACGTFLYYWDTSTSSFLSCVAGLTANNPWSFVSYNGYIYGHNGTNNYLRLDLSSYPAGAPTISVCSAAGAGPTYPSKQLFIAGERIWAVGNTTYPDRAYYCGKDASGVGTPTAGWNANNYLAFPRESANLQIIGGTDWRDKPFILTEKTASLVLGDNNSEFEQPILDDNIGCASRHTIAKLNGLVLFLGKKGVYAFGGGVCRLISLDIQEYIDDINQTYISAATAMTDDNCYYLSYCSTDAGGVINNRMLVFDTRIGGVQGGIINGGWVGPHTIGAGCMFKYYGSADNDQLYFGDASATGFVYRFMDDTVSSFNGGNIDADAETYDISYQEIQKIVRPDLQKQIDKVTVFAEPEASGGDLTVSYYNDDKTADTSIGTISLATTGKERGDLSGQTSVTRTVINHPLKVTPAATSRVYFNRLRFRCNDATSRCKIRKYIQTAVLLEKPDL